MFTVDAITEDHEYPFVIMAGIYTAKRCITPELFSLQSTQELISLGLPSGTSTQNSRKILENATFQGTPFQEFPVVMEKLLKCLFSHNKNKT